MHRQHKFGVVLLVAGASTRMGRPKLLLDWFGETILQHLVETWRELGSSQIAVVCREHDLELGAELDRIGIKDRIVNREPGRGMFSSIQCAAAWTGWSPELERFVITLGDQPHVKKDTLAELLNFSSEHSGKICQPVLKEKAKHPVILPVADFIELAWPHAQTLKDFLENRPDKVIGFETSDEGVGLDIDTPEDYDAAKQKWLSNGGK